MKKQNIVLVGPMGAGKTCLGVHIARLAGKTFYDSDVEVERRCGAEIGWIFEIEGEAGFRRREAQVIAELMQLSDITLSTGHGAVVTASNRTQIGANSVVVYLKVALDIQLDRAGRRVERRPMVDNAQYESRLIQLNEARAPLYEAMADFTYVTDDIVPKDLAEQIVRDVNGGR